jgi:hypothetical protein
LQEIKQYKPSVQEKIDLPTTFKAPAAPAKPEFDLTAEQVTEAELAEEEWPALEDPIDNPELYNGKCS